MNDVPADSTADPAFCSLESIILNQRTSLQSNVTKQVFISSWILVLCLRLTQTYPFPAGESLMQIFGSLIFRTFRCVCQQSQNVVEAEAVSHLSLRLSYLPHQFVDYLLWSCTFPLFYFLSILLLPYTSYIAVCILIFIIAKNSLLYVMANGTLIVITVINQLVYVLPWWCHFRSR